MRTRGRSEVGEEWASPFSDEVVEEGVARMSAGVVLDSGLRFDGMPSERLRASMRELVRPGKRRPTYAPRVMRSSSVSPGRSASRERERICAPKTMARCSLVSTLLRYTCSHISCPVVVGMRARTSHSTIGSFSSSSGLGESMDREVSTGIERGGRRGCDGVETPGVAGGVKAGDIIDGGGSDPRCCDILGPGSCTMSSPTALSGVWKSKPLRLGLCGCGVYSGGRPGDVWDGRSGMLRAMCAVNWEYCEACNEQEASPRHAHRAVRSDVVLRAEGVSVGVSDSCHNSRSRSRFRVHWKPAEGRRHLAVGARVGRGWVSISVSTTKQSGVDEKKLSSFRYAASVICTCASASVSPSYIRFASLRSPQSTLRSLPQTSSAFFLPLVSGTYQERNAKKNAESAAKIK